MISNMQGWLAVQNVSTHLSASRTPDSCTRGSPPKGPWTRTCMLAMFAILEVLHSATTCDPWLSEWCSSGHQQ